MKSLNRNKSLLKSKWLFYSIILFAAILLNSCIDRENYKFSAEYVKELYDKTFPVKDIDPDHNWNTTSVVNMNVTIYEDELETYKVKVYDDMPGNVDYPVNCLAEGVADNKVPLKLTFDCPIANDTVYVSRVDKGNRRLVQAVAIQDRNSVTEVTFGEAPSRSRAYTFSSNGVVVEKRNEPYTTSQISSMLSTAMEVQSDRHIGANYGIISPTNVYKLTKNGSSYRFAYSGSSRKNILIVTTRWQPTDVVNVGGDNLTIVIANGGSFSGKMYLSNGSNLIVLKGGVIDGANTEITITNASNGHFNYNGGTITANSLSITTSNGEFYNAGTLKVGKYQATNSQTILVNNNKCYIGTLDAVNASIHNGCYMEIADDCSTANFVNGNSSMLKCKSLALKQWGDMYILMGLTSMIDCAEIMRINVSIQGCGFDKSLLRVRGTEYQWRDYRHYYRYVTIECGDEKTDISHRRSLAERGTVALIGEANVIIPAGDCTGEGSYPGNGKDVIEELGVTYTYCYEDYYPVPGDYDFNDIVMDVTYRLTKKNNKITKVEIPIKLTAVGATYSIGGALQLIGIDKTNIKSAIVTNGSFNVGDLFLSQAEETSKNRFAVIPIFSDAHFAISGKLNRYMFNTAKGHEKYADATPREILVTVEFNTPLDYFGLSNMDLFIARPLVNGYYDGQKDKTRVEVHLREFWSYRTANGVNFENNEAIAGNRTWAIYVPNFKYPYETVPIYRVAGTETQSSVSSAYPLFQQWASNRNTSTDWYLYPNPGTTYR